MANDISTFLSLQAARHASIKFACEPLFSPSPENFIVGIDSIELTIPLAPPILQLESWRNMGVNSKRMTTRNRQGKERSFRMWNFLDGVCVKLYEAHPNTRSFDGYYTTVSLSIARGLGMHNSGLRNISLGQQAIAIDMAIRRVCRTIARAKHIATRMALAKRCGRFMPDSDVCYGVAADDDHFDIPAYVWVSRLDLARDVALVNFEELFAILPDCGLGKQQKRFDFPGSRSAAARMNEEQVCLYDKMLETQEAACGPVLIECDGPLIRAETRFVRGRQSNATLGRLTSATDLNAIRLPVRSMDDQQRWVRVDGTSLAWMHIQELGRVNMPSPTNLDKIQSEKQWTDWNVAMRTTLGDAHLSEFSARKASKRRSKARSRFGSPVHGLPRWFYTEPHLSDVGALVRKRDDAQASWEQQVAKGVRAKSRRHSKQRSQTNR
jgi:hypothetical protein